LIHHEQLKNSGTRPHSSTSGYLTVSPADEAARRALGGRILLLVVELIGGHPAVDIGATAPSGR
jgi:hypothetical protein